MSETEGNFELFAATYTWHLSLQVFSTSTYVVKHFWSNLQFWFMFLSQTNIFILANVLEHFDTQATDKDQEPML
jgi:hypothetical protein